MEEILILKPFSTSYNTKQFCCEDCGYTDWWEIQDFEPNEIIDVSRIDLTGLTEDVDFEYLK